MLLKKIIKKYHIAIFIFTSATSIAEHKDPTIKGASAYPISNSNAMVVSSHYLASEAGIEILKKGG